MPVLVAGGQWAMLMLTGVGMSACIINMQRNVCSKCVNFSCPLNPAPKQFVDDYLAQNPMLPDAWLKAGYRLD